MAEVDLKIGGRVFKIVCADGEEPSLHKAAALLDAEASLVIEQLGRLSEARLLLMAGLMLADRTVGMTKREKELEQKVEALTTEVEQAKKKTGPNIQTIQVPIMPEGLSETLEKIAGQAENLAKLAEEKAKAADGSAGKTLQNSDKKEPANAS